MSGEPGLFRSVGGFVGHIVRAIRSPVDKPDDDSSHQEISRRVEESDAVGPGGQKVTLRRTTIEEVEIEGGEE